MNRIVCPKGHYYNGDKYLQCPHCIDGTVAVRQDDFVFALDGMSGNPQSEIQEIQKNNRDDKVTVILPKEYLPDSGATSMPFSTRGEEARTGTQKLSLQPQEVSSGERQFEADRILDVEENFLPVGYLVCIRGRDYGRSFPLRTGVNTVKEQAYVLYEPRKREFYLKSADRDSLCYCNDEVLLEPKKIQGYDRITLGDTTFLLIVVCGERFSWKEIVSL